MEYIFAQSSEYSTLHTVSNLPFVSDPKLAKTTSEADARSMESKQEAIVLLGLDIQSLNSSTAPCRSSRKKVDDAVSPLQT